MLLILWMAVVHVCAAPAQDYRGLDSLIALSVSVDDTVLPRLYHEISWESREIDPMLGIQYGLMALESATDNDDHYHEVLAYNSLAMNERNINQFGDALGNYHKALSIARKHGMTELEALEYSNIGNLYIYQGLLDSAYCYEMEAWRMADSIGSNLIWARVYMNMGMICRHQRNTAKAIEYLEKSYFIRHDSLRDFAECLPPIGEMANIYMEERDYVSARAIINLYINDELYTPGLPEMAKAWYRMAQVYYKMRILDTAANIARQSLQYAQRLGNVHFIENNYKLLDSIYMARRDYMRAALCCKEYIDISDTVFNVALDEQLRKIRYSSEYIQNKSTLDKTRLGRINRLYAVLFALAVLVILVYGIMSILDTGRQARKLNVDMEQARTDIINSLEYAHAIQGAALPDAGSFGTSFADRFVMYVPRDIVSGDFYWRYSDARYEMLAVADCTGHGVPGAMLTMLGVSALQDIARQGIRNAGKVLGLLRQKVKYMLRLNDFSAMKDGMDITLIIVDRETRVLDFAGAFNSLIYIRNGEYHSMKATRVPIGYYVNELPFESQYIDMIPGDVYYLLTDGFTSQFGGPSKSKYPHKLFRKLLLDIHSLPMSEQKDILMREFQEWKDSEEQVDDVTVVGFRV